MNMVQTKRCSKCGETKPVWEFNKNKTKKDGCSIWCKACFNAYNRAYQQTPERKAYNRAYYQTLEYKARISAYQKTSEYKAYRKVYNQSIYQTLEYKADDRAYKRASRAGLIIPKSVKKFFQTVTAVQQLTKINK